MTKREAGLAIFQMVGRVPWTEIYFQRNQPDLRVAKLDMPDGGVLCFVDDDDDKAMTGLFESLQADQAVAS